MVELYGWLTDYKKELVATFDSMEAAKNYVSLALLPKKKQGKRISPYHDKSVLADCLEHYFEEVSHSHVPHNPIHNWNI
jgi:hypothetical protein